MSTLDFPPAASRAHGEPEQLGAPALDLDVAKYRGDLEGLDLTQAQQTELLTTLWSIMQLVAQSGLQVGDVDICGSILGTATSSPVPPVPKVESLEPLAGEDENG